MSMFGSDWDEEEENDEFEGNLDELIESFEKGNRNDFSARELMEIFHYYSANTLTGNQPSRAQEAKKQVLQLGINHFPYIAVFAVHLAEILIREKNYRLAKQYIFQAMEYSKTDLYLKFLEVLLYAEEGKIAKAKEKYQIALELLGNESELALDILEMFLAHRQFKFMGPLLRICKDFSQDVMNILERIISMSNSEEADYNLFVTVLDEMIEIDPYNHEAWYLKGTILFETDNYSGAAEAFDYAITINDNFLDAKLGYIESIYELGEYNKVLELYEEIKDNYSEKELFDIQGLIAWSYHEIGDSKKAKEIYRKILQHKNVDTECWFSMGLLYTFENKHIGALPYLKRAYELNPYQPEYGLALATCYLKLGNKEEWDSLYDMLADEHPENGEIWLDWSTAWYESGEMMNAIDVLHQCIENNHGDVRVIYRLATLYYLAGHKAAAEIALIRALELDPNEHSIVFAFAPELKKATSIIKIIAQYTKPNL